MPVPCSTLAVAGSGSGAVAEPCDPACAFPEFPEVLGSGQALLCWAGHKHWTTMQWLYRQLPVAHTEVPWAVAWITSLFPWRKPSRLLTHAVAGSRKHGVEGCLSPSLPSLPPWQSCFAVSWHFVPQEEKQRVGLSREAWRSSARWLPGSAEWAIFSFPSPPCLHQHPKSTAAIGSAPRGAAQHVLVTGWTSRQRQRGKSEACKYL